MNSEQETFTVNSRAGQLTFRKPTLAEYDRFSDKIINDRGKSAAGRELVLSCVVSPSRDELKSILEQYPAISMHVLPKLQELAAGGVEVLEKN